MSITDDRTRLRITVLGLIVVAMFGVLLARLWFLQVLAGDSFARASTNNHVRLVSDEAPRGRILDRNGKVLVKNRTALAIGIRREDFPKDPARATLIKTRLSIMLGIPIAEIEKRMADKRTSPYKAAIIAEDVPMPAFFTIRERSEEYPGVETVELPVRTYPQGSIAAHVLGYVGEVNDAELKTLKGYRLGDTIGRTGIERQYERYLRGTPGLEKLEVDAGGHVLRSLGGQIASPGNDVYLSIDADAQRVAERAMVDGISRARARVFQQTGKHFKAPAGATVVLDARTGEVVAMASYPTFDLRRFVGGVTNDYYNFVTDQKNHNPLFNRAVQAAYPPGSTFKPFMAMAALASGTGTTKGSYPCQTVFHFGDRDFKNWRARNAHISLAQSLIESCDTVYYNFARTWWLRERRDDKAGKKPYEIMPDFARRFGLGLATGIDLPPGTETDGRIPDRAYKLSVWNANKKEYCDRANATGDVLFKDLCDTGYQWRGGDAVNMSIGQGDVQVTPLQLAVGYAAIANGGRVFTPHIGMKVLDHAGRTIAMIAPHVRATVVASKNAFSYVQYALRQVPVKGTAVFPYRAWPLSSIPMAAKTGSAEINGKQPFSWFASYGPANAPRYVGVAVFEEAGFGSQVAGPVVRRIMDELFHRPALPIVFGTRSD